MSSSRRITSFSTGGGARGEEEQHLLNGGNASPQGPGNQKRGTIHDQQQNSARRIVSINSDPTREVDEGAESNAPHHTSVVACDSTGFSSSSTITRTYGALSPAERKALEQLHVPVLKPSSKLQKKRKKNHDGEEETLLISRWAEAPAKAYVSDVHDIKGFWRLGPRLSGSEMDGFGQWISTANRNFDSLDFEEVENTCLQEEKALRGGDIDPPFWKTLIIAVLGGIATGLLGFLVTQSIAHLSVWKFTWTESFLHSPSQDYFRNSTAVEATQYDMELVRPYFLFVSAVAVLLVIFGEPLAKGSGIPEIKCYLNGIRLSRVLRLRTLICKGIGIIFSVASGLPVGIPGPMVHCGAAMTVGLSQGKSTKLGCDTGFLKEFRSDIYKRNFATAGAAAGISVAFGAPIGGLLFAVESMGSFWSLDLTITVFVCSAVASMAMQIFQEPTGVEGHVKGIVNFGSFDHTYNYSDLPFCAGIGILGGILGAAFVRINSVLTGYRTRFIAVSRARKFAEVMVINWLCSSLLFFLSTVWFGCSELPDSELYTGNAPPDQIPHKTYGCNKGEYNDMATYFFQSMTNSVHMSIHSDNFINFSALGKHFVPYFFLTVFVYGMNVPLGMFLPAIALGATMGHIYSQLCNMMLPGTAFLSPSAFAIFGATAMLAGWVRMTIAVVVIMMEATANTTFFYPMCIVTMCAKLVGDCLSLNVYDVNINHFKIPYMGCRVPRREMHLMCAVDVMVTNIVLLPEIVTVGGLVLALKKNPLSNALIIIDKDSGVLKGLLLRRSALVLIGERAWEQDLEHSHFCKSSKEENFRKLQKCNFFDQIPEEADDQTINLGRYMDRWPVTYTVTTPLSRIYSLHRRLGLRHLIIVDDHRRPVGIVTRKQLCFLEMAPALDVRSTAKASQSMHYSKMDGLEEAEGMDEAGATTPSHDGTPAGTPRGNEEEGSEKGEVQTTRSSPTGPAVVRSSAGAWRAVKRWEDGSSSRRL